MSKISEDYISSYVQAGDLEKGGYVFIETFPCKINEISFAKTGKHGHAKAMMKGVDILTDKKHEYQCTQITRVKVPKVVIHEWCLVDLDIKSNELSLLDNNNEEQSLKLPEDDDDTNEEDLKTKKKIIKMYKDNKDNVDAQVLITILECCGKLRPLRCKCSI